MSYYILESKNQGVFIMKRPEVQDDLEFDYGIKKETNIAVIDFIMDQDSQGEIYDQVLTTLPGLTISEKFKQAFDSAGVDNIDYYPAKISNTVTGEVRDDIYVANIIGLIECMDKDSSEFETYPGMPNKVNEIESLVLNESAIKEYKVFRMKEFDSLIIVDESLRNSLTSYNLTNTELIPLDKFSTD